MPQATNSKRRKYKHLLVPEATHKRVKEKAASNGMTINKTINTALDISEGKTNEFR